MTSRRNGNTNPGKVESVEKRKPKVERCESDRPISERGLRKGSDPEPLSSRAPAAKSSSAASTTASSLSQHPPRTLETPSMAASTSASSEIRNVARLCGWSTSRCGYCHGRRAGVLARVGGFTAEEDDTNVTNGPTPVAMDKSTGRKKRRPHQARSSSSVLSSSGGDQQGSKSQSQSESAGAKARHSSQNENENGVDGIGPEMVGHDVSRDVSCGDERDDEGESELMEEDDSQSSSQSIASSASVFSSSSDSCEHRDSSDDEMERGAHGGDRGEEDRVRQRAEKEGRKATKNTRNTTKKKKKNAGVASLPDSSRSYGTLFEHLSCSDYQILIDRGWRRSGRHLYLPDNWSSCCPAMPIRLDVSLFIMDKRQRKVWRTMDRALVACSAGGASAILPPSGGNSNGDAGKRNSKGKKQRRISNSSNNAGVALGLTTSASLVNGETLRLLQCRMASCVSTALSEDLGGASGTSAAAVASPSEINRMCSFKVMKNVCKKKSKKPNISSNKSSKGGGRADSSVRGSRPTPTLNNGDEDIDGRVVVVSCVACCAIAGRTRGQIDSNRLAECAARRLRADVLGFLGGDCTSDDCDHMDIDDSKGNVRTHLAFKASPYVVDVTSLPGGRVNVTLRVAMDENGDGIATRQAVTKENYNDRQKQKGSLIVDHVAKALGLSPTSGGHKLTVRSIPSDVSATQPEVHRLFARYQHVVHGDPDPFEEANADGRKGGLCDGRGIDSTGSSASVSGYKTGSLSGIGSSGGLISDMESGRNQSQASRKQITTTSGTTGLDGAVAETSRLEQIEKAKKSFDRFLVETPLPSVAEIYHKCRGSSDDTASERGVFMVDKEGYDVLIPCGSYHQQYRIDGVLIAVGVVDVLPHCLSSVYSFYDPDLSGVKTDCPLKLNLGKYTALREIEWVRRAMTCRPKLKYYYLGFYIHSCPKMRYKAEYKPSCLLCPSKLNWVDFELAKPLIEAASPHHCCVLSVLQNGDGEGKRKGDGSGGVSILPNILGGGGDGDGDGRNGGPCGVPVKQVRDVVRGAGAVDTKSLRETVENMHLDLGQHLSGPLPAVTVKMLNAYGRRIVDPLVEEFVRTVGVDVSRRCIIKL